MKTWAQFLPFIEPEVMGCPQPVIEHHLRLATRDFCQRSKAWREWLDPITADGVTNRYDYDVVPGQQLAAITRALRNGEPLRVTAGRGLPDDWESGTSTQLLDTLVHFDNEQFMVFALPDAADVITVEMAFAPTSTASSVGDILYTDWADEVATGCKARLWAMKKQPWSDTDLALDARTRFEGFIARAANRTFARRDVGGRRVKKAPL